MDALQNQIDEEPTALDPLLLSTKFILDFYYGDISLDTINSFAPHSSNNFTEEEVLQVVTNLGLNALRRVMPANELFLTKMTILLFISKNRESKY